MFCSKCGNEIAEGTAFCPKCGAKVVNVGDGQQSVDIPVADVKGQQTGEVVENTQRASSNNAGKVKGNLHKAATIGRVLMWGSLLLLLVSSFGALRIIPAIPVAGVAIGIILSVLGAKRPLGLSKIIELVVAVILLVVIAVSAMSSGGGSDKYVQMVKDGTFDAYPQMTVGKAFDGFLDAPKWESGLSENNERFVNVKGGISYYDEKAELLIQFVVDEKTGSFQYNACEINGIPQSDLVFWGLLETIYNGGSISTESGSQSGQNYISDKIMIGETQSYDNEYGNMEVTLDYVQFADSLVNTWTGGYEYPDEGSVFLCAVINVKNIGTANGDMLVAWNTLVYDGMYEFRSYRTEGDITEIPPLSASREGAIIFMVPADVMGSDKSLVLNINDGGTDKAVISYTITAAETPASSNTGTDEGIYSENSSIEYSEGVYDEFYNNYRDLVSETYLTWGEYATYSIYDIDKDGVQELIVSYGESDADWYNEVWSEDENGVIYFGVFYDPVVLYEADNGNGIYAVSGHQGVQKIDQITKVGNVLYIENIMLGELAPGEEYYSNDNPIEEYSVSDMSILD